MENNNESSLQSSSWNRFLMKMKTMFTFWFKIIILPIMCINKSDTYWCYVLYKSSIQLVGLTDLLQVFKESKTLYNMLLLTEVWYSLNKSTRMHLFVLMCWSLDWWIALYQNSAARISLCHMHVYVCYVCCLFAYPRLDVGKIVFIVGLETFF